MKRTSRQATSKSGTPNKSKPKRVKYDVGQITKKIQKWKSASSIASKKTLPSASEFVNKLWRNVDKSDPEAVRKVLELHASGKGGDDEALYFSSSRFWHIFKALNDEHLSYFSLSLWSVRLEAANFSGNCVLVGDENCSAVTQINKSGTLSIAEVLKHWDTVSLAKWYEVYYNLTFGAVALTDNSEVARNVAISFNDSQNSDEMALIDVYSNNNASIEAQPPDEPYQNLEQSIQNLYDQFDRTRPRFLYADKGEIEDSYISDRIIVVLNVMSDVDYVPPSGWSFRPFDNTISICIPLTLFEGMGIYDQISLAQDFLTFKGDNMVETFDASVDTRDLPVCYSISTQTDPALAPDPDLISPPLNFDRRFQPTNDHRNNNHICRCMACNTFLCEFIQEWGFDLGIFPLENIEWGGFSPENVEIARAQATRCPFNNDKDFNNNLGGNYNFQCITSHTIAESKATKRSVDMDRLSQSSPEIESSSSSTSDIAQRETGPEIEIEAPPAVPPQSPLL